MRIRTPEYRQAEYQRRSERAKAYVNRRRKATRKLLDAIKNVPCMDCGGTFHPAAMQFDHRDPSTKVANVGQMTNHSLQKVMEEVAKCDIVCANCHAIRTWVSR